MSGVAGVGASTTRSELWTSVSANRRLLSAVHGSVRSRVSGSNSASSVRSDHAQDDHSRWMREPTRSLLSSVERSAAMDGGVAD